MKLIFAFVAALVVVDLAVTLPFLLALRALPGRAAPTVTVGHIPADAVLAFERQQAAWNDCNRPAYFGGFTESLECYYNKADATRAWLSTESGRATGFCKHKAREPVRLVSMSAPANGSDVVAFMSCRIDDPAAEGNLVVMRNVRGAWLIAGEASRKQNGCYAKREYPPAWNLCAL